MVKEVKEKWINALRSGEYEQGKGKLRKDNNYCCLGVLCDIYNKETGDGEWVLKYKLGDNNVFNFNTNRESVDDVLSYNIANWAGLVNNNPNIITKAIAGINDDGATFEEIANLIETHL